LIETLTPLSSPFLFVLLEKLNKKLTPPAWIVFYSAMSLVIGLATYG
jgi:phosphate/sulfate permease